MKPKNGADIKTTATFRDLACQEAFRVLSQAVLFTRAAS